MMRPVLTIRLGFADNVVGSDINQNDMGHDTDATSGNASFGDADDINQGDWYMHSNYLKTDGFTGESLESLLLVEGGAREYYQL